MRQYIEQLVNLSKLDKEIDSFEPKIKDIKSKLERVQKDKSEIENSISKLNEEVQECELKKRKNELYLQELADKLENLSKKSGEVKSEKELKAIQLEEEIAKEQVNFTNEEIARLENVCETKVEEKKSLEDRLKEIENNIVQTKEEVDKELEAIDNERKKIFEKKQELISKMPQKILAFYEKIRRWAGNSAVVPIKKQACMGCFMKINDVTYAKAIKAEEIVTCPHCGRILYLESEEE